MYELSDKDKNDPDNQKLEGNPDFKGPGDNRKCTDIIFMLLIIACWVALTFLGFVVCGVIPSTQLDAGNPWRLINGIDYEGQICGVDSAVKDKSKIFYLPDFASSSAIGICVESCPTSTDYEQFICTYDTTVSANPNTDELATAYSYVAEGLCMYHVESTDAFNYCVYTSALTAAYDDLTDALGSLSVNYTGALNGTVTTEASSWFDDFSADLFSSVYVILGFGIGVALVVGFTYLFFLRIPGVLFLLTWGLIALIFLLWLVSGLFCYTTAQTWQNDGIHSSTQSKGLLILSYILFAIAGLWFVLILFLRKRIQLALGVTKEAARAVASMKLLMVWPVIQTLGVLCFLIPWTIYALYLASSGAVTVNTDSIVATKTFTYSDNIRYAGLYMLFSWFWTSQFVIAMGQIVVAMAVSTWYFCTEKKKQIGNLTVITSIKKSLFYHIGTGAFGSLIIAIIKTIRAIIAYFQRKAKKSGNKVLQAVLCCIQCCMWCIEKCMKFLNKNAYIQTAIYGYNFCKSAKKAFFLIARNIVRIAAVSMVGDFVLFIGKVLIPILTTILAYLVLAYSMSDQLHGLYTPCIFIFLLAYFVALMFVEVFGMAISTILMCYVADEEMNGGKAVFAEGSLKVTIKKTNSQARNSGMSDAAGNKIHIAPSPENSEQEEQKKDENLP
mmetsp:Transcript_33694/g.42428  ORF Transcript_33694/g.42428 Transcript_33694/m.42428 type:complete len:669 (+) Transcript_33694:184-2190(+)